MNQSIKKEVLVVFFCFLVGFALRYYNFDKKSLWVDEIYTYQDSRYGVLDQIKFYKEEPTHLHPPLFFILTHIFYPFEIPERDLRIIPLVFGALSIPMIYLLARQFSPNIALLCTISFTFMTYHIYLSQDGRPYALGLFLGILGLYFFLKYLNTLKTRYLPLIALCYSLLFYTSYSSIPFIIFSQMLWAYQINKDKINPSVTSLLILNGLIFILSSPWIVYLLSNYQGQEIMHPLHTEGTGSLGSILYGIFHDWMPHFPLKIVSVILLILFPIFAIEKKNAFILLGIFILPIVGVFFICKVFNITHFITSRYFINLFPILLVSIFLSLENLVERFKINKYFRLNFLFLVLFLASNLITLPLYYQSEKQDLRGLVNYLKGQMREGDNIFVLSIDYMPGLLHYFGVHPLGRYHLVSARPVSEKDYEYEISFYYQGKLFSIFSSKSCCHQYVKEGGRLWIVVTRHEALRIKKQTPFVLKGFFDGSFLNYNRFPTDASMYLFLWDPASPDEKGIDFLIE